MKRAALISVIVGAALAIVPAAFAVEVSDGGGVSGVAKTMTMAPTSYQDALKTYGSISTAHQLGGGSEAVTPLSQIDPAIRAVLVRNHTQSVALTGKALADFYDTGAVVTSQPSTDSRAFVGQTDTLSGNGTTPATANSSSGTDWNALVPVMLFTGLLLATGWAVATRRRHQLSV